MRVKRSTTSNTNPDILSTQTQIQLVATLKHLSFTDGLNCTSLFRFKYQFRSAISTGEHVRDLSKHTIFAHYMVHRLSNCVDH